MKCLKFLVLLCFAGFVAGGGQSHCDDIEPQFLALVQIIQDDIDRVLATITDSIHQYPALTNSLLLYQECQLNISIHILANGTSQISGVSIDYILDVLHGITAPPYVEPLDCIEPNILAFIAYVANITQNVIPGLRALKESTTINSSTPCFNVTQISNVYYQGCLNIAQQRINDSVENAALYVAIGKLPLLLAEIGHIYECGEQLGINAIAEVLNIDPSTVAAYLQDTSIAVSPPLSCVRDLVINTNNTISTAIDQFNNSITVVAPPSCEPLFSQFKEFKDTWYDYVNGLHVFASNNSYWYPVLTPFFISDFECELDIMIILAANATSTLTGIDSEVIYQILTTNVSEPFPAPLDCIAANLIFLRELIWHYKNIIIPRLSNFAVTAVVDTSTCNKTYNALKNSVPSLRDFFYNKEILVINGAIEFKTIGFGDLYLDAFGSVGSCVPSLLSKFVGAVLNADGSPVESYLSGNSMTVPYPFSCAKIIITILDNMFSTALVSYIIEEPLTIGLPTIPAFRG